MYQYKAVCTRVIDGDTVELNVDLGFNIHHIIHGRLYNVNAPEIFSGTDRANGQLAKAFLANLIEAKTVIINTFKDKMTFNRWVVELKFDSGANINELIESYCKTLSV